MSDIIRWTRNQADRSAAIGMFAAGLISLWLGWLGVSDHVLPSEQIAYLASGGLFGLFLLGGAATLWLSADLRDEWRQLGDLTDELRRANDLSEQNRDAGPAPRMPEAARTPDQSALR